VTGTTGRVISRNIAVPAKSARANAVASILARASLRLGLAWLATFGACDALQNAVAEGDTRTLSFHHVHTGEDITVTFKRNGRYDEAALKRLDWFMRDWRKGEAIHMDPHLYDLLWEVYREVGARQPIEVICGYRSPGTNAMLHARSSGVARFSQHTLGHAIDFAIPGVPLAKIREVGLRLQRGGVGFYPTSGSPFVHMDTGTVRHWPSVPRAQLVRIFPNGRTVHIPADGQPLPGYRLALAEVERHGSAPSARSLEAARAAGLINDHEEHVASLLAQRRWQQVDLADNSDSEPGAVIAAATRTPLKLASLAGKSSESRPVVPLPVARPARAGRETVLAQAEPTTRVPVAPYELAALEPPVTGSAGPRALAYAAEPAPQPAWPQPSASFPSPHGRSARAGEGRADGATLGSPAAAWGMAIGGQDLHSPWMRAVMLTPSIASFMTMTRVGKTDLRWVGALLHKPTEALAIGFGSDPQGGMVTARFTGSAVVFLATAKFAAEQRTAWLR
jgi:uncharacterized protein YcbK (DUF882 family)